MNALKIQVKNGRLSFDEPTELPDGTVVELHPTIDKPQKQLSWEEIKALYPDEWVVLVDLLFNDDRPEYQTERVIGGVVFDHHPDRTVVGQRTREAPTGKLAAVFFTGKAYLRKPR